MQLFYYTQDKKALKEVDLEKIRPLYKIDKIKTAVTGDLLTFTVAKDNIELIVRYQSSGRYSVKQNKDIGYEDQDQFQENAYGLIKDIGIKLGIVVEDYQLGEFFLPDGSSTDTFEDADKSDSDEQYYMYSKDDKKITFNDEMVGELFGEQYALKIFHKNGSVDYLYLLNKDTGEKMFGFDIWYKNGKTFVSAYTQDLSDDYLQTEIKHLVYRWASEYDFQVEKGVYAEEL